MVSRIDINNPCDRFISREYLEEIKARVQRLPFGEYTLSDDNVVNCKIGNDKNVVSKKILKGYYPGIFDIFLNMKKDFESLIRHVEGADKENDYLLSIIKEQNVKNTKD